MLYIKLVKYEKRSENWKSFLCYYVIFISLLCIVLKDISQQLIAQVMHFYRSNILYK